MAELLSRAGVLFAGLGVLLLGLLGARSEVTSQDTTPVPIAYAMVENPETEQCIGGPCRTGIVLIDPVTAQFDTINLGEVYPETLAYSPDYRMISYQLDRRLYVLDLETRRTRFITRENGNARFGVRLAYNAWSPDSTQIAYLTPRGIEILNLITDENHVITHLVPRGGMRWSPDGARLLFTANPANTLGQVYLYTLDVSTGELTNLTPHRPIAGRAVWTPDGSQIIAPIGGMRGASQIWGLPPPGSPSFIMDADGSNLRPFTLAGRRGWVVPRWILNETRLVYPDYVRGGWIDAETNLPLRFNDPAPPSPFKIWGMDLSPDGTGLVVLHRTSDRNPEFMLTIYDLEMHERHDFPMKTASFAYPEWGS